MNKLIEKFIELTQYTYVYGEESLLKKYLPPNVETDSAGNYFLEIGETETMFCCHLDTAAFYSEKVEHDFWKDKNGHLFVGTTGDTIERQYTNSSGETIKYKTTNSTILGADDKSGTVIMLNMIDKNVPGLYYFFVGEESGRIGSKAALSAYREKFKKYKRCVAFDRRGYGSIISKQMGMECCSQEFVEELSKEFKKNGMDYKDDKTGIYTDSATFMDVIPECTNLSVGYFNEHSQNEMQNLTYLIKLANTSAKIDWEKLPTKRNPNPFKTPDPIRSTKKPGDLSDDELWDIFIDLDDLLESVARVFCKNYKYFVPEKEMIYIDYATDTKTSVWVHEDGSITIGGQLYANFNELKNDLMEYFESKPVDKNIRNYTDGELYDEDDYDEDDEDEEDEEEYDTDDGYGEDVKGMSDSEFDRIIKNFKSGLNLNSLLFDILEFSHKKSKNVITLIEMNMLLDKYNRNIESFIYWLYSLDNDPKKTHGIKWDDDKGEFIVE